ncbi:MAG: DNA mismatch repair protein MutS [Proteobacteria bacterium]|nr:DNA mismatch repair protein MutS [Pseudomonadota bacterium]
MERLEEKITPMMQQYLSIKERYKDAFLFFRVGDFYELFYDDAIKASSILNIALTSRNKGEKDSVPLCGVPYHSVDFYLNKLIQAGYKIVLCDQVEDPKTAKGVVKREVVKVITPGTVIDLDILDPKKNNFIAAVYFEENIIHVAFADASCSKVQYYFTNNLKRDLFERFNISELIVCDKDREKILNGNYEISFLVSVVESKDFVCFIKENIKNYALPLLEYYLKDVALIKSVNFEGAQEFILKKYMFIDENAQRDLEIFQPILDTKNQFTLLSVMDNTITPMGGRLLRNYLAFPLINIDEINERLDLVEALIRKSYLIDPLKQILKKISDLERILTNLESYNPLPRNLIGLVNSLKQAKEINLIIKEIPEFKDSFQTPDLSHVTSTIENAIVENPPTNIRDGGVIKDGFSKELDELREILKSGTKFIIEYEKKERDKTGIASLKVRFNKVFGYYIEVTKSNLSNVPDYYQRKQTLVNAERFITEELKELEDKVLSASEKSKQLEIHIFSELIKEVLKYKEDIKRTSDLIAKLDVIINFANNAISYNYVRPHFSLDGNFKVNEGRHPFVERAIDNFVPNDTMLDKNNNIMLITGPNMAGKSTYMRQVALISIMAQTGAFVPAKYAQLPIIEQIFTRIGTSDFLASGKSTFMVEMLETARILKESNERSLVILDEVGRGTSTYDGMAIAWSVLEYLAMYEKKPYVLFSTHYHELTELSLTFKNIKNYNVSVREWKGEIVFLHKLQEGVANRSYGIHVAKLAGLPESVIQRAQKILEELEEELVKDPNRRKSMKKEDKIQLSLFSPLEKKVFDEIKESDLNNMTPLMAFDLLRKLKGMIED